MALRNFTLIFLILSFSVIANPFKDLQEDLKKAQDALNSIVKDKEEDNTSGAEIPSFESKPNISSSNSAFDSFARLFDTNVGSELITEKIVDIDDFGDEIISYKHYTNVGGRRVDVFFDFPSTRGYSGNMCDGKDREFAMKRGFPFELRFPVTYKRASRVQYKLFNGVKAHYSNDTQMIWKDDYFTIGSSTRGPDIPEDYTFDVVGTNPITHLRMVYEKALLAGESPSGDVIMIFTPDYGEKVVYKFSPFHSSWTKALKNCMDFRTN